MTMSVRMLLEYVAHMPTAPTLLEITTVPACLDLNQTESRNFKLMMGPTAQV